MKKRFILIFVVVFSLLVFVFGTLYMLDHKRMEENRPVVFSTWGKKYAPTELTPEEAIVIAKKRLDPNLLMITNFDNPKIEEVVFKTRPSIYLYNENTNIIGRELYKITFNTEQDGLLGPIVEYIDKYSGELIGGDYRE